MSLISFYRSKKNQGALFIMWSYLFNSFNWLFEIKELYGEKVFELKFKERSIIVFIRNQTDIWDNYDKYVFEIRKKRPEGSFIILGSNFETSGENENWIKVGYYCDNGGLFEYEYEDALVLRWSSCDSIWSFGGDFQNYDIGLSPSVDYWKETNKIEIHELFSKLLK